MHRLISIATLFLATAFTLVSQQPGAPIAPEQTAVHHDALLNPALPTVFIVGDSTARNNADLGWGDHFAPLFDTSRINVANRAIAGRSSRTYINEGHWRDVIAEMKPGDYLLLQMGHNDGGDLGGAKPRGTLKGIGDETKDVPQITGPLANTTETVHTYGWYMRKMIDEAKAKGVTPAVVSLTIRDIWKPDTNGTPQIERDMGYSAFIQQIAQQEHILFIDMAPIAADKFQALGPEKTASLFPKDHTHTSAEGAQMNAESVAQALRNAHSPLVAYLK